MTSFGLLFSTLFAITSAGQQFVASPTSLEIGLTKQLQIECTSNTDNTLTLTTQIRILFSKSKEQPVFVQLGFVDSVLGIEDNAGGVDSGEIVGNGTSILRLTWNYPKQDRAGRRYYLSADSNILVTADAEAMCEVFGGYLVEIDSAEEYQFIARFLSNFTQYQLVLTGGSDEVLENNWINTYSQTAVKYIDWGPVDPNGGRGANCLYFYKEVGWKMVDHTCFKGLSDYTVSYLCEIVEE